MNQPAVFDHFIWGGRDLERMSARFEALTGVKPSVGGRHAGLGTHNALASLGEGCYFELMALDPTQSGGGFAEMMGPLAEDPMLFAYMVRVPTSAELDRAAAVMLAHGIRANKSAASRTTLDGRVLRWELLIPQPGQPHGHLCPKFIAWDAEVTHPSHSTPQGCHFESFGLRSSRAPALRSLLADLNVDIVVQEADHDAMELVFASPRDKVVMTGVVHKHR